MNISEAVRNTEKTQAIYKAASAFLPIFGKSSAGRDDAAGGGTKGHDPRAVVSETRRPECAQATPILAKARNAIVTDVDGHEYIDFFCAGGAAILGHAEERIVVAVNKAVSKGADLGSPTETEVRLAELVASRFPTLEKVCFVHSDAEALHGAVQTARAVTGRRRVLFVGACQDDGTSQPGGGRAPVPHNDEARLQRYVERYGSTLAAVVVEPVATRWGLIKTQESFLVAVRQCCDAVGSLVIYDETLTGLRASGTLHAPYCGNGAAEARSSTTAGTTPEADVPSLRPDLTVIGGALGGGLPLAAFGGRRTLMDQAFGRAAFLPAGPGGFSSHANLGLQAGLAAGIVTLQAVSEPHFLDELETRAERLDEGLRAATGAAGLRCRHTRVSSLVGIYFAERRKRKSRSRKTAKSASREESGTGRSDQPPTINKRPWDVSAGLYAGFYDAMLERGILLPPSPLGCLCICAAHTDEQIERTIEAAHGALQELTPI